MRCDWREYVPISRGGGGHGGDHGRGVGSGAGDGGGADDFREGGGTGGGAGGVSWDDLRDDAMGRGSGLESEDGSGRGSAEGGDEGDVDVDERVSGWRDKKQGADHPDSFRPSEDTMNSPSYPRFQSNNLGRFAPADKELGELAFVFFSFMMPLAVVALLVQQVRTGGVAAS